MRSFSIAACIYAALAIAVTWPLAARLGAEMPEGGDNLYIGWALAWVAHAAVSSPLDLFDGNIFYPAAFSLAYSDPNVSSGILLAPIYLLLRDPALSVNLLLLGSFLLCGLSAYALARDWTGSERGALAAGIFFAFSPMRLSHLDHIQLYAFWWTPLGLYFADRFLRKGRARDLLLAAGAISLQAYASLYLAAFGFAAVLLLFLLAAVTGRVGIAWRRLAATSLAATFLAALLCLPLAYAYGSVNRTWATERGIEECLRYSASPLAYLSAPSRSIVWGAALGGFADPVAPWEKLLFPGAVPLVLAALGVARERRSWILRYGIALAIVCAVLSLGPYLLWRGDNTGWPLPYLAAYHWLWPIRALRAPARWGLAASLGLALAAG
ncbi:MAG: hypothetical protein ACRDH5_08440, partial [bacterium]